MRVTAVLLIIICLNAAIGLVEATGLFTTAPISYDGQLGETVQGAVANQSYLGTSVQTTESSQIGVGDFITGLYTFIQVFFGGIALPYIMLTHLGVPSNIAWLFTFPVYVVYMMAIIQFISGRYVE